MSRRASDTPRRRGIAAKIRLLVLLVSGVALLIGSTVFISMEYLFYRNSLLERVSAVGNIVAINSGAAMSFDDEETVA